MRMQKEEKMVVVLLPMALGSLAIAEWAFGDSNQSAASGKPDSTVSVEGHDSGYENDQNRRQLSLQSGHYKQIHLHAKQFWSKGYSEQVFTPEIVSESREICPNSAESRR